MPVTIVSWNIAGGRPMRSEARFDYAAEDIDYFADRLHPLAADVICLQETHIGSDRSIAREIANKLGYLVHEVANSPSHIDEAYSLGNAILSKVQPSRVSDTHFPYPDFPLVLPGGTPAARHDKGFQVAEFEFGRIINMQMMPLKYLGTQYDLENGKKFAEQMEATLLPNIDRSTIICGDFNFAKPELLYFKILSGRANALPDVPTRPEGKKTDFIFVPAETEIAASGVIETNSDHFLCWTRLDI